MDGIKLSVRTFLIRNLKKRFEFEMLVCEMHADFYTGLKMNREN